MTKKEETILNLYKQIEVAETREEVKLILRQIQELKQQNPWLTQSKYCMTATFSSLSLMKRQQSVVSRRTHAHVSPSQATTAMAWSTEDQTSTLWTPSSVHELLNSLISSDLRCLPVTENGAMDPIPQTGEYEVSKTTRIGDVIWRQNGDGECFRVDCLSHSQTYSIDAY